MDDLITADRVNTGSVCNAVRGEFNYIQLTPIEQPTQNLAEGLIYSDVTDHHLYVYNGTTFKQLDN